MKINITFDISRRQRVGFVFDRDSVSFAEAKRKPASYEDIKSFIFGEIAVIMGDYDHVVWVAQEEEKEEAMYQGEATE